MYDLGDATIIQTFYGPGDPLIRNIVVHDGFHTQN